MGMLDDRIWARKLKAEKQTEQAQLKRSAARKVAIEKARRRAYRALRRAGYPTVQGFGKINYQGQDRMVWYLTSQSTGPWEVYLTSTGELLREIKDGAPPWTPATETLRPYDALYEKEGKLIELEDRYYEGVLSALKNFPNNVSFWKMISK